MTPGLTRHLWHSPTVRAALRREVRRCAWSVAIYVLASFLARYIWDQPVDRGFLWDIAISSTAIVVLFIVSTIRAVRRVLREHGELE